MQNDATHRIINYLMLSVFILLNFYIGLEYDFRLIVIFIIAYILGTEVFSPDLDTNSKPSQRLGILSYPIRILSRHRGLGHNILIGWLLKVLYLVLIGIIIYIVADKIGYNLYWILNYIDAKIIGAILIGLFLSNAMHIIADNII